MSRLGLNLPNLISLARLLLVPLTIWLILCARYGFAFWIVVAAGVSDALDGFIAKRFDRRTRLGALLDPIADKAMLVSVYITLGIAGELPSWLVILVGFRGRSPCLSVSIHSSSARPTPACRSLWSCSSWPDSVSKPSPAHSTLPCALPSR